MLRRRSIRTMSGWRLRARCRRTGRRRVRRRRTWLLCIRRRLLWLLSVVVRLRCRCHRRRTGRRLDCGRPCWRPVSTRPAKSQSPWRPGRWQRSAPSPVRRRPRRLPARDWRTIRRCRRRRRRCRSRLCLRSGLCRSWLRVRSRRVRPRLLPTPGRLLRRPRPRRLSAPWRRQCR
jgi:hypothetical protein